MVGLLTSSEDEAFATGAMNYLYQPATPAEVTSRILLPIRIEQIPTIAALDTGAPYSVCSPQVARRLALDPIRGLERKTMFIRGSWVSGLVYRLSMSFAAERGDDLEVDATVFVPDPEWEEGWGDLPSFIGLSGCLERMRFAVDPGSELFYFGRIL